ncbi:DUF3368 domain-containing protein [Oscillatoria sp. FACHB-1406]|uniref:DUF3368 domain-containing protein n=1 Tax=Oscillatoria sp. FACHB-1406 TaxID=2692846 RepID=UPI0016821651|nr:DUF3368 domain-containing protein [Oscillatoria sp. FACHB-1406]MBD2576534.1 DUF3368 domain-containing protein [Oscillatoria sp. FACHB-1406]
MIVVSDTSPIFYLSTIGKLDLLHQLYENILIPQAVFKEITNIGNTEPSATTVPTLTWVQVRVATDRDLVERLLVELDIGEAEAIALALEYKADRLLIDERLGRTVALRLGLQVTGVLGVLVTAKRRNLIQEVKPLLDTLIEQTGFWLDRKLYAEVLEAVGESV